MDSARISTCSILHRNCLLDHLFGPGIDYSDLYIRIHWSVSVSDTEYYVVEARLPIRIDNALSVEEAARKAADKIEREYGLNISNWFLRVFAYEVNSVGPVAEYFSNPAGSKFRKIDGNIEKHNQLIEEGKTPNEASEE